MLISFEGLPGAGKSTLMSQLPTRYKKLPEPLNKLETLTTTLRYKSLFSAYNPHAFKLQIEFLVKRLSLNLPYTQGILSLNTPVLCERTGMSERYVFFEFERNKKKISDSEFSLLDNLYSLLENAYPELIIPDKIIWFDISVDESRKRIEKRNREGECGYWTYENLYGLSKAYNKYISTCREMGIPVFEWSGKSQLQELISFIDYPIVISSTDRTGAGSSIRDAILGCGK